MAPRRIAIALDGSHHSRYSVLWYIQYMSRPDDVVCLINIIEPFQVLGLGSEAETQETIARMEKYQKDESEAILKEQAQVLAAKNIQTETKSIKGYPKEEISDAAVTFGATCLLIGTRGMNTVQRVFVGSVTDATVHDSKIPVMIVRPPAVAVPVSS